MSDEKRNLPLKNLGQIGEDLKWQLVIKFLKLSKYKKRVEFK